MARASARSGTSVPPPRRRSPPKPLSHESERARTLSLSLVLLLALLSNPTQAGELNDRFHLTQTRVLQAGPPHYTPDFLLADLIPTPTRRFTNFSGDVSGRYLGALAANRLDLKPELLSQVLQLQKPDGHFGGSTGLDDPGENTMALLWGQGRLLIGLMEAYEATNDERTLLAARRLGDFLLEAAPTMNAPSMRDRARQWWIAQGYICWTQNLEGVVALWKATGEDRYRTLAEQLAERIEQLPGMHSHGLLTSLRGLVALYAATEETRWLQAAEEAWARLADSEDLWIHGAIPEALAPGSGRDEGCSIADWVRFNLDLWRITAESKYLEHAEYTIFNAFFANQFPSGDFGHVQLRPDGFGHETARAWWCCTLHGLRAFADIRGAVFRFRPSAGVISFDLPLDGELKTESFTLRAESSLHRDGRVLLASTGAPPPIRIRIPAWAESVSIDGEPATDPAIISNPGPRIVLHYNFRTETRRDRRHPGHAAIQHGPWLLAAAEADAPTFFDEPAEHNRVVLPTNPVTAEPTSSLQVPAGYRALKYLPAGYPEQPQTVVLRPISQFTAPSGSARRQIWLPVEGEGGKVSRALARIPDPASFPWLWIAALALCAVVGFVFGRRRKT